MRIWLIQPSEQLPLETDTRKLRTLLLAEELASRGHQVVWWSSCFNHLRKSWTFRKDTSIKLKSNLTINFLKGIGYRKNISLLRWLDLRLLSLKLRFRMQNEEVPEVVLTSLPPYDMALEAVEYANQIGALSIVDIRDKWPDNFVDVSPRVFQSTLKNLLRGEFNLCRRVLQQADIILSMTKPLLDWGLLKAKRCKNPEDQVFFLGACREQKTIAKSEHKILLQSILKEKFIVSFIGTFSNYHNPMVMIKTARLLKHIPQIAFVLAGDGQLKDQLLTNAADLPNVFFIGWLESPEISILLKNSHIGLCTSGKFSENEFLPNKVFSYLSEGVPIGSVFGGELKEIIQQQGIGFNFESPEDLASSIEDLYRNPDRHRKMAEAARIFFAKKGDAKEIYKNYADLIESSFYKRKIILHKNNPQKINVCT